MNSNIIFAALFFAIGLSPFITSEGRAYYDDDTEPDRYVDFNIVCNYQREINKDHKEKDEFEKCETVSQFEKRVTKCGDEFQDHSVPPDNPRFEVKCDGRVIFDGHAHRFTDEQGTRIQAEANAFPATVIPHGALTDGHKYVYSNLELGYQFLKGNCFIYTGPR